MMDKGSFYCGIFGEYPERIPPDEMIEGLLSTLSPRERIVLRLHFQHKPMTHKQIGAILPRRQNRETGCLARGQIGVTSQAVSQIEARALRRLRHPARSRGLRSYCFKRNS